MVTQLGDYHVKKPTGSSSGGTARGRIIAVGTVVLLALIIVLYWYLSRDNRDVSKTVVESTSDTISPPPPVVEPEPVSTETPPVDLNTSDEFIRDVIGMVSSHPKLAEWLVDDDLIRRFVVVVDNIADGSNPAQHVPFMRPTTRFSTTGEGTKLRVDVQSYRRYDLHAQLIASLDTQGTANLYLMLKPLIDEAYVELGNPKRPFSQTLERAIVSLLNAPAIDDTPTLVEHAPFFQYTDPDLEAMSPAQKQLLATGPDNTRAIQGKLRQVGLVIGIPDSRLP